jgi:hypothetical protein
MLGQYYNPEVERGKRLSGLLSGMGAAILNPSQDPAHRGGSGIGEIGRAFAKGSAQAGESGSGYLHEAYKRKIAADEMRRKQYTEDEQLKEDAAMADWVAGLSPEMQADARANPQLYYQEYIKSKYAGGADGNKYFKGDIVQIGVEEDGVTRPGRQNLEAAMATALDGGDIASPSDFIVGFAFNPIQLHFFSLSSLCLMAPVAAARDDGPMRRTAVLAGVVCVTLGATASRSGKVTNSVCP